MFSRYIFYELFTMPWVEMLRAGSLARVGFGVLPGMTTLTSLCWDEHGYNTDRFSIGERIRTGLAGRWDEGAMARPKLIRFLTGKDTRSQATPVANAPPPPAMPHRAVMDYQAGRNDYGDLVRADFSYRKLMDSLGRPIIPDYIGYESYPCVTSLIPTGREYLSRTGRERDHDLRLAA